MSDDDYDATARVAAGVAWLDDHLSGWWRANRFNLDRFQIHDGCNCVIGQLAPEGYDYYGAIEDEWLDLTDITAQEFGFDVCGASAADSKRAEYDALEAEWRRVIVARREAAEVAT